MKYLSYYIISRKAREADYMRDLDNNNHSVFAQYS